MSNVSTYEEFVSSGMKGKTREFKPTDRKIGPQRPGPQRPGRPVPKPGKPEQPPKKKHGNVTCADKLNDSVNEAGDWQDAKSIAMKKILSNSIASSEKNRKKPFFKPSEGIKVKKTKLPKAKGLKRLMTKFTEFKGIR